MAKQAEQLLQHSGEAVTAHDQEQEQELVNVYAPRVGHAPHSQHLAHDAFGDAELSGQRVHLLRRELLCALGTDIKLLQLVSAGRAGLLDATGDIS